MNVNSMKIFIFPLTLLLKKKMALATTLILLGFLIESSELHATESNSCPQYFNFLENSHPTETEGCDSFTKFLIANTDLSTEDFLSKYRKLFGSDSTYRVFINAIETSLSGDTVNGFLWLDSAELRIFNAFDKRGLAKRGYIYTSLLKKLKFLALTANLRGDSGLANAYKSFGFSEELGRKYRVFDELLLRSDVLLLCLLRVDNLIADFDVVVDSKMFLTCVEREKN